MTFSNSFKVSKHTLFGSILLVALGLSTRSMAATDNDAACKAAASQYVRLLNLHTYCDMPETQAVLDHFEAEYKAQCPHADLDTPKSEAQQIYNKEWQDEALTAQQHAERKQICDMILPGFHP